MKICKDCKHYEYNDKGRWSAEIHLCGKFPPPVDMVTGEVSRKPSCISVRAEQCGVDAKWWVSKND